MKKTAMARLFPRVVASQIFEPLMLRRFRFRPLFLALVSGAALFASNPAALANDSQPGIEENYDSTHLIIEEEER